MNKEYDIVVLTDQRYVAPEVLSDYVKNVLFEDRLVVKALEEEGLKATKLAWDDKDFDWSSTKAVLFRSTWDYFDRFNEFSQWLEKVSQLTQLINSEKIIRWNIDKHYLRDLKNKGVHTLPTVFIEKDSQTSLKKLLNETQWNECILKPCISGGARHTYKLNVESLDQHEGIFQELIRNEAMMLQPFIRNIVDKGEISLMIIGGKYTHAVLKKAKPGDFRVQDDWGGSVYDYAPDPDEISFAELAVKSCIESPVYARVDMVKDNEGKLAVVELELIEPELWFRKKPEAARTLAKTVKEFLAIDDGSNQ